mgnify:CR=1 FL=1
MFLRNCRKLCFTIFRFALFLWEKILFWLKFLHYEVFNVHLPLFATACLVYRMSRSLSTTFLTFFRKFFASLYRASGARLVVSRDSLFIIPNLLPLVNSFFNFFRAFCKCTFYIASPAFCNKSLHIIYMVIYRGLYMFDHNFFYYI